jgi:hypothetical protein
MFSTKKKKSTENYENRKNSKNEQQQHQTKKKNTDEAWRMKINEELRVVRRPTDRYVACHCSR